MDHDDEKSVKESAKIKRKQKLRETLGLQIHFNGDDLFYNSIDIPKIQNDDEFIENLLIVFDVCLPDVLHNLESAFTRFRTTKEYYWVLADKLRQSRHKQ